MPSSAAPAPLSLVRALSLSRSLSLSRTLSLACASGAPGLMRPDVDVTPVRERTGVTRSCV